MSTACRNSANRGIRCCKVAYTSPSWVFSLSSNVSLSRPANSRRIPRYCTFTCMRSRIADARRGRVSLKLRAEPRVLPGYGNVLVIAAEADIGTVAVGDLDRLELGKRERHRPSDARAGLLGIEVANAVDRRNP